MNKPLTRALFQAMLGTDAALAAHNKLLAELSEAVLPLVHRAQENGEIRKDMPAEMLAQQAFQSYFGTLIIWSMEDGDEPLDTRMTMTFELFFQRHRPAMTEAFATYRSHQKNGRPGLVLWERAGVFFVRLPLGEYAALEAGQLAVAADCRRIVRHVGVKITAAMERPAVCRDAVHADADLVGFVEPAKQLALRHAVDLDVP